MTEANRPPSEGQQPSEEEIREYVKQLRATPAGQVVSEILYGLLNAAQAKLGRRDARLVIDLSGLVLDHARQYLPSDLAPQFDRMLGQLRLGQVQAEKDVAAKGEPEPNDFTEMPTPPTGTPEPAQPSQPTTSRLWVPGQGR